MNKAIIVSLTLASSAAAFGQGAIQVDSLVGSVIKIQKSDGTDLLSGSAQVYRYDAAAPGGIGANIGAVAPISGSGRFRLTGATIVDGVAPGNTLGLIVRAWDGGDGTYAGAAENGTSKNWTSKPLGGTDAGGNLVFTPKLDGFESFKLSKTSVTGPGGTTPSGTTSGTNVIPEPSTIALGVLGAAALVLRRRK